MFKMFKRTMIVLPVLLFGFFIGFSSIIKAASPVNVADSAVYTEISDIKDVYFNNRNTITVKSKIQSPFESFIKFRVISPINEEGAQPGKRMATDWIKKHHAENDMKLFSFEVDFKDIIFDQPINSQSFGTIGDPESTYYVEVNFYKTYVVEQIFKIFMKPEKVLELQKINTEILKVVRVTENPMITINMEGSRYQTTATTKGYLTRANYFYSPTFIENMNRVNFEKGYLESDFKKDVSKSIQAGELNLGVEKSELPSSGGYVYFMVQDGNNNMSYNWINLVNDESGGTTIPPILDTPVIPAKKFGDIIIVLLISVLIVTMAFIVTQKVIDRKKTM